MGRGRVYLGRGLSKLGFMGVARLVKRGSLFLIVSGSRVAVRRYSSIVGQATKPLLRGGYAGTRSLKTMILSFGPQHPAAHGILRVGLEMGGEVVLRADPHFGLLHRGVEKLMEGRPWPLSLPYFDRFDYVANLIQEHGFCRAVELGVLGYDRGVGPVVHHLGQYTRVVFDELSRILNHLLTVSACVLDLGAMGPIFWAFEERELIMEVMERVSGARMHTALYEPFGGSSAWATRAVVGDLGRYLLRCGRALNGAFLGLLNNRVWKTRLVNTGALSRSIVRSYGITGIPARSAGFSADLRIGGSSPYDPYRFLSLRSFRGLRGDNYDRFLIRVKEVVESFRVVGQALVSLSPDGPSLPNMGMGGKFTSMEEVIEHFGRFSAHARPLGGLSCGQVESPKGVVGVWVLGDGSSVPRRVRLRSPVAHNMNLISHLASGVIFGDFVASFCSLDIVLGEIDR